MSIIDLAINHDNVSACYVVKLRGVLVLLHVYIELNILRSMYNAFCKY